MRPSGAGARARAMRSDAHRWAKTRVSTGGRLVARVVPGILAISLSVGAITLLGLSVGPREPEVEFDYHGIVHQQQVYQEQLDSYLRDLDYFRQLELMQPPIGTYPFDYPSLEPGADGSDGAEPPAVAPLVNSAPAPVVP